MRLAFQLRGFGETRYVSRLTRPLYRPEWRKLGPAYRQAAVAELQCGGAIGKSGRVEGVQLHAAEVWVDVDADKVAIVQLGVPGYWRLLATFEARDFVKLPAGDYGELELSPAVSSGRATDIYAMTLGCFLEDLRNVQNAVALLRDEARFPSVRERQAYVDWRAGLRR